MTRLLVVIVLCAGLVACAAPASQTAQNGGTHTVIDTAGRAVSLPVHIQRIADVGATPVVNSLLFLFGAGNLLVNALPAALNKPDFALQKVFAPRLATNPVVEGNIGSVNTEALVRTHPDVVLTNNPAEVAPVAAAGFPVVVVSWSDPAGLTRAVTVIGQILGQPARAAQYLSYLGDTNRMVTTDLAGLSPADRPRVAYLQYADFAEAAGSQAHYWLPIAGGDDVEYATDAAGNASYSPEQILAWDPQVILVQARSDAASYEHDPRFATVAAIKDHRVYVVPAGAQHWGNATTETPLVVLWAAHLLHPHRTTTINIQAETRNFYQRFYGVTLSTTQISDILGSSLEPTTAPR